MNNQVRYILLLPVSILYGITVIIRNWLYNTGLLPSAEKAIPTISIGNITIGGTGKTPHAEFLITELRSLYHIGFLSRGYKRLTKGFVLARQNADARKIGDEPYQIYQKFAPIPVAVCENRSRGIDLLQQHHPELELILLDDAFQHRRLRPGFSILLTDYHRLHTRDHLLPGGNLREPTWGSKRADIIIVTKCPQYLSPIEMRVIELEVRPSFYHEVYFSTFVYDEPFPVFIDEIEDYPTFSEIRKNKAGILLVTGIVTPQLIVEYLRGYTPNIYPLQFADHHDFTTTDFDEIEAKFNSLPQSEKMIIVTEKDAARLIKNKAFPKTLKNHIFALPVRVKILNHKEGSLIKKITDYVEENSGNRRSS